MLLLYAFSDRAADEDDQRRNPWRAARKHVPCVGIPHRAHSTCKAGPGEVTH